MKSSTSQADDVSRRAGSPRRSASRLGRALVVLTILFFLLSRGWLLWGLDGSSLGDVPRYREWARLAVDCRQVPYREFSLEYPPLALWVMELPRLVDSNTYGGGETSPEEMQTFLAGYVPWYQAEMLLADVVSFCLLLAIGPRLAAGPAAWLLPAAYAVLTASQPYLIYNELDIGLAALLLGAVWCWLRSLDGGARATAWALGAYLCLGAGTSYKLIPVVLVPFLLLADWRARGWRRPPIGRAALFAAAALGPFLWYLPSAGGELLSIFRYHAERGIHLESVWGSVVLVARWAGIPCDARPQYGAVDVISAWTPLLKDCQRVVLPLALVLLLAWAVWRGARYSRAMALDLAIVALFDSAVLSHVFSPQYLNWLLPLALILACDVLPRKWPAWLAFGLLSATAVGISTWTFPHHPGGLEQLLALLVVRSASLVALAVILNVAFFRWWAEANRQGAAAS